MADTREKLIELTAKHQQEADKLSDAAKTSFGDNRTVSVFKWMHSLAAAHKEFVAELDEVSTLLENGVTVQKWIPVTERLPEYENPVMGWDAELRDMGIVNFIYGKFLDIIDMSETNVTHWMPLPQPPKEG